ncbi:Small glutamine-rich tetratricopeptide repeat-containing protein 2 [Penicillium riverlandense]|uniref:Small glutamine-rich tetratricopeptide repeat-containing protein 2 n=1 Tax=Penicillium riverlandense TaxID=1903569 RepID=UPI0025490DC1|nr:Small glutamine-rich tetratricopeptide repeat-containing protein 2 [Penicillium riverlandense]KAJ5811716.1 Small glutamine-rich tetratricopeptide repeat-containing protein 2 [Penicillium riverlandense]
MSPTESKKRLALAIIDFLGSSLKDGTLTADDAESIEIAQSCIADTFKVDPTDSAAVNDAVGGQSLANIYSVYEKLRSKSSPQSADSGAQSSEAAGQPKPGAPTTESDKLKSEGNGAMARKEYSQAIELYTKALEIAPANPIYLSNRAAAFSAAGQHEKAADDAELATAVDPKYSKAWSRLGLARFDMGDYNAAKEAYEKGIEAEGNGGSEAMKRGLETSKRKIEEAGRATEPPAEDLDTAPGASRGAGGMPDLSSLASMFGGGAGGGGGGMPDLGSMMNNPMFSSMAQNLMSNPDMLNNLMSNPRLRQMAESFGQGGGMPDMSSLMSDPSVAEMARNMMGGGGGAGRGEGGQ